MLPLIIANATLAVLAIIAVVLIISGHRAAKRAAATADDAAPATGPAPIPIAMVLSGPVIAQPAPAAPELAPIAGPAVATPPEPITEPSPPPFTPEAVTDAPPTFSPSSTESEPHVTTSDQIVGPRLIASVNASGDDHSLAAAAVRQALEQRGYQAADAQDPNLLHRFDGTTVWLRVVPSVPDQTDLEAHTTAANPFEVVDAIVTAVAQLSLSDRVVIDATNVALHDEHRARLRFTASRRVHSGSDGGPLKTTAELFPNAEHFDRPNQPPTGPPAGHFV